MRFIFHSLLLFLAIVLAKSYLKIKVYSTSAYKFSAVCAQFIELQMSNVDSFVLTEIFKIVG